MLLRRIRFSCSQPPGFIRDVQSDLEPQNNPFALKGQNRDAHPLLSRFIFRCFSESFFFPLTIILSFLHRQNASLIRHHLRFLCRSWRFLRRCCPTAKYMAVSQAEASATTAEGGAPTTRTGTPVDYRR